ncbi:SpvB/TcaC N-terminal domain-containing protein, partial [Mesonia sp. K7]|uniref:SpvB/TcaC N-terminal domain-containing protein n=1 Tax=Mesonia sp. K7 TaxID=2218606 RepID=UPI001313F184
MRKNYFNTIRKSYASVLIVAIMGNMMVFAQPIQQLMAFQPIKPRIVTSNSEVWTEKKAKPSKEEKSSIKPIEVKPEPSLEPKDQPTINTHTFRAMNTLGVIGKKDTGDVESPYDNFFDIEIPESIAIEQYQAYIKYELFGLASALSTTKSINGHLSYGGMLIEKDDAWHTVKEPLANHQLQKGKNEIYFTRRADQTYQYQIKNLKLVLEPKTSNSIVVSPIVKTTNGTAYINGYVQDPNIQTIRVTPLEIEIPVVEGRFEYLIHNLPDTTQKLHLSFLNESITLSIEDSTSEGLITLDHKEPKKSLHAFFVSEQKEQLFSYEALSIDQQNLSGSYPQAGFVVNKLEFKDVRVLNSSLYNVTAGDAPAFRVQKLHLPDSVPVKLHLKFDENKIPQGYSAKDVKTFYYNKSERQWKALPTDSISYQDKSIISRSFNNETDYINGIIKVAESPETSNFTPTTISDMEYANPSAGIVSIAPPTPNSTGSVTTSFPLKLPQGRNGMQPSLSVNYNSEAGNGWMGVGWDIQTPAITLNTKWGAPAFDTTYESELYSLNGADLVLDDNDEYTNPHRKDSISRNSERQFYERKEGSYQKIIRHGSDPSNYWWEVTDKLGNRSFYGGDENGQVDNAIIKTNDSKENIVHWALHKTIDNYGNRIEYLYDKSTGHLDGDSSKPLASSFYINKIFYTLHSGAYRHYEIDFNRNVYTLGNASYNARKDKILTARNGTLQLTDDLLTEVEIKYIGASNQIIRTYQFEYEEAPFNKRQLSKISEFDTNGELFYSNTIEYFNKDGNGNDVDENEILSGQTTWTDTQEDLIFDTPFALFPLFNEIDLQDVIESPLGTSFSSGFSLGFRGGIGFNLNPTSKSMSIGGVYNYTNNTQKSLVALVDINGDGLSDKVYKKNGNLYYRPNLLQSNSFGNPISLSGINDLSETKSKTNTWGIDVILSVTGGSGKLQKKFSTTRTTTDGYFVDRNGDGLPDYVNNGNIKFNHHQSNPLNRSFSSDILDTENYIESGLVDQEIIDDIEVPFLDEIREENPQFDAVKVWEAPFTGTIKINSRARVTSLSSIEPGYLNRFKLTIERLVLDSNGEAYKSPSQNSLLIAVDNFTSTSDVLINPKNPSNPTTYDIPVNKGDLILFRTHNKDYGTGGVVEWNTNIVYQNSAVNDYVDENRKEVYKYTEREDYLLSDGSGMSLSDFSSVSLDFNLSNLNQIKYTDDIQFIAEVREIDADNNIVNSTYHTVHYDHVNEILTGNTNIPLSLSQNSNIRNALFLQVKSTSNIAWELMEWKPILTADSNFYYPPVEYVTFNKRTSTNFIHKLPKGNGSGEFPAPNLTYDINGNLIDQDYLVIDNNLDTNMFYSLMDLEPNDFPVDLHLVIKGEQAGVTTVIDKKTITIDASYNVINNSPLKLRKSQVSDVDVLYVAFYTENKKAAYEITNNQTSIGQAVPPEIDISLDSQQTNPPSWSGITLQKPIFVHSPNLFGHAYRNWGYFLYNGGITLKRDTSTQELILTGSGLPDIIEDYGANLIDGAIFPDASNNDYLNNNQNSNIDDIAGDFESKPRYALFNKDNRTENDMYNPAVNSKYFIDRQQTPHRVTHQVGRFGETNLFDSYVDLNDIDNIPFYGFKQRGKAKGDVTSPGTITIGSVGAGTDIGKSETKTLIQLMDLNGDKYPEVITPNKIQYTNSVGAISIVKGNDFYIKTSTDDISGSASVEESSPNDSSNGETNPLMFNLIKSESTNSTNGDAASGDGNLGNSTNVHSGSIGVGSSENRIEQIWLDMNGDGLSDKVYLNPAGYIDVSLNHGYGFYDEKITWGNGHDLLTSKSVSGHINANFPISSFGDIAIGAGLNFSSAKKNVFFLDVNGDGLIDLVFWDKDNDTY